MSTDDRSSPLSAILPVLIIVGVLGFVVMYFFGEITEDSFFPLASTLALLIYLLTFIDIRIGLAALILAVGLSPEVTVGGVGNIRFEDFVVPAIFISWITRILNKRESFSPTILKGPIILYLVTALIATLMGISRGSIKKPDSSFLILGKT